MRERLRPTHRWGRASGRCSRTSTIPPSTGRTWSWSPRRIARVKPDGVVTDDGRERRLDTLILATGFATTRASLSAIDVVGRGGRTIGDAWRDGAHA